MTTRRWRSRSACAPPRRARSPGSRRPRCGRWPSLSRCFPAGCAGACARSGTPPPRSASTGRRSMPTCCRCWPAPAGTALRMRFGYVAKDDRATQRHAEPSAVVHSGYRWYLVAFDLDRDDWRTFRIDRIRGRPSPAGRGQRRVVPGGDPAAYVRGQLRAGQMGETRGRSGPDARPRARVTDHESDPGAVCDGARPTATAPASSPPAEPGRASSWSGWRCLTSRSRCSRPRSWQRPPRPWCGASVGLDLPGGQLGQRLAVACGGAAA